MAVRLRCPFCHDALGDDRVRCATCLTPHDRACFEEHGGCAGPGCGPCAPLGTAAKPGVARWRRGGRLLGALAAGLLLGLALAPSPKPVAPVTVNIVRPDELPPGPTTRADVQWLVPPRVGPDGLVPSWLHCGGLKLPLEARPGDWFIARGLPEGVDVFRVRWLADPAEWVVQAAHADPVVLEIAPHRYTLAPGVGAVQACVVLPYEDR